MEASQILQAKKLYDSWFLGRNYSAYAYQKEAFQHYLEGKSGVVNAPTGFGKTFSLWIPILCNWKVENLTKPKKKQLYVLWITPVRALANDLQRAMQKAADELEVNWQVAVRTGDTDAKSRSLQKTAPPQCIITTPESVHLLLASKGYAEYFGNLEVVVVDEWHELLGSKRGVQVELAFSRLRGIRPNLQSWGLSATIGNLEEATGILLGESRKDSGVLVRANLEKRIDVIPILPDHVNDLPWGGHLGIKLLPKLLPILENGKVTLVFTNTRAQAEIWYQEILNACPDLAGLMALHHGSLSPEIRNWVEMALHQNQLQVVVCTSSLDLGVDFRNVEQIIQIGGPKGVARFMQRAGRSGHQPEATSTIYFLPTQTLELIECAALKTAIKTGKIEPKMPVIRAWDVLIQYLVTLAISDGFKVAGVLPELRDTHAYSTMNEEEWQRVLNFITQGGKSLESYDEFNKVKIEGDLYYVKNRAIAMRHRVAIGTIVQEQTVVVKFLKGGYIGNIEEYFISRLKTGDIFSFAGKNLQLIQFKDMSALVRKTEKPSKNIPSWQGGKMPLSSQLSYFIRQKLTEAQEGNLESIEMQTVAPLLELQNERSILPRESEFLIECLKTRAGYHFFFYTFEGRFVNEGMAAVIAMRIGRIIPITFSISLTDYGFELLTDTEFDIEDALAEDLLSTVNLSADIQEAVNTTELASKKFRGIAQISGLTFAGMPGKELKSRHLQASSRLFFKVFTEYEPDNLLLRQAYDEVLYDQLDEIRLRAVMKRIESQKIRVKQINLPTPLCFSIMVERIRDKFTNENLEQRVARMLQEIEKENQVAKV